MTSRNTISVSFAETFPLFRFILGGRGEGTATRGLRPSENRLLMGNQSFLLCSTLLTRKKQFSLSSDVLKYFHHSSFAGSHLRGWIFNQAFYLFAIDRCTKAFCWNRELQRRMCVCYGNLWMFGGWVWKMLPNEIPFSIDKHPISLKSVLITV